MNRDSGTDSANGGWLRRLVRPCVWHRLLEDDSPSVCNYKLAGISDSQRLTTRWRKRKRATTHLKRATARLSECAALRGCVFGGTMTTTACEDAGKQSDKYGSEESV